MNNWIRDLVNAHPHANFLLNRLELLIDTVHKFQGDERDAMIFSPVVSEGITDGAVSFLKKTDNLFNVAITRARAALIVVGDPAAAKSAGVTYLAAFADYVENLGQNPRQQAVRAEACSGPEYPKVAKPELVSDWRTGAGPDGTNPPIHRGAILPKGEGLGTLLQRQPLLANLPMQSV
jgi:AAA domain